MPVYGKVDQDLDVNPKSNFVIVSYWWGRGNVNKNSIKGKTYEQQVDTLIQNCISHKCNYYFVEVPEFAQKGRYQEAINYKARFILEALNMVAPRKVIYVDTDLQIRKYPALLDVDADFLAVNYLTSDEDCTTPYQAWIPGGILGFANTHYGRKLCQVFVDEMDTPRSKSLAEDKVLAMIVTRTMAVIPLRCFWLPETYMFMFMEHVYVDGVGYTHISTLKEETAETNFKPSDVAIYHEDFETGSLDDVYAARLGNLDRMPRNYFRTMGRKLRCISGKFKEYNLLLTNKTQVNHMAAITDVSIVPEVTAVKGLHEVYRNSFTNLFTVVSFDDNDNNRLIRSCDKYQLPLVIYQTKTQELSKRLYAVLKRSDTDILYVEPGYYFNSAPHDVVKNSMKRPDLMLYNDTVECNDPRAVRINRLNVLYLAKTQPIQKLLALWVKQPIRTLLHEPKALEYVINKGLLVRYLRCHWLKKNYCACTKGKNVLLSSEGIVKIVPTTVRGLSINHKIEQCGVRYPLDEDGESRALHHKSPVKSHPHKNRQYESFTRN